MLELMKTKHPRYQHTPDHLFLHTFVFVDDWLKQYQSQLPHQPRQKASYSVLRNVALTELAQAVAQDDALHIIDSKPLPVAKGKRRHLWAKCLDAQRGFSTFGAVFGFKLHALVTSERLFRRWGVASADTADVTMGKELLQGLEDKVVIGDKAYLGTTGITPARKNMTRDTGWNEFYNRVRKRIETTFSSLVRSLTLHAAQVKPFQSLRARVNLKIAAFNLLHSGVLSR